MKLVVVFLLVLLLFSCVPVQAITINPSVESQPFFCKYSVTEWTPLCVRAQGKGDTTINADNNTFLYNTTINESTTISNQTSFFNTTIGNNLTTFSNYTYFYLINITQSEMNQTPGPKGDKGDDGYTPVFGLDYFNGTDGADGAPGTPGTNGTDGLPGEKGEKGDIGLTGSPGPQGEQGPPGLANMTAGPPGADGADGAPGTPGTPGANGTNGIDGTNGADGYTPIKGVDYFDGAKGDQGIQGEKGDKGDTGATGAANMTAGPKGDQGINGTPGYDGATGPAGLDANVSTMYPVGSVYGTVLTTDPATTFGFGTWLLLYNYTVSPAVYVSINPVMTSNTAPSGNYTYAISEYSGATAAYKGSDGDTGSTWASSISSAPWWWMLRIPTAKIISNYTIVGKTGDPQNTPTAWKLNGSTDGSAWTTLDTRSGVSWTSGQLRSFQFTNNNAYSYYNLTMSANGGGNGGGFMEINFYNTSTDAVLTYYWKRVS